MSSYYSPSVGGAQFKNPYSNLTQAEAQVQPLFQQEMAEEEEQRSLWQPVQKVFDLLLRGQYVSANVAEEVVDSIQNRRPLDESVKQTIEAAWQGLTGERKGSYGEILSEETNLEERRPGDFFREMFGAPTPPPGERGGGLLSEVDWADVLGFAGDVLLDPLTYFTFGSSKAAFSAAKKYADDAVEVARRELAQGGGEKLQKLAQEQFDPQKFNSLMQKSEKKARNYAKKMGADVSRYLNETYKQSFRKGLKEPADKLREDMATRLDEIIGTQQKGVQRELFEDTASKDIFQEIKERLPSAYQGAGERTARFMRQEFGKSVRDPNMVSRSLSIVREQLGKAAKETKVGSALSDAWWSFLNNSKVGQMRKRLGFKNPYQKAIRIKELQEAQSEHLRVQYVRQVADVTEQFDDEVKQAFVRVNDAAEELGPQASPFDVLDNPEMIKRLDIEGIDTEQVSQLADQVRNITRKWDDEYNSLVAEGIVESKGTIANYLPAVIKEPGMSKRASKEIGARQPGFAKTRGATREQMTKAEIGSWARIFGLSKEQAEDMIRQYNLSDLEMNLDQLLTIRAVSQAKVMKRGNVVRSLKEFSIPKSALGDDVTDSTLRMLGLTEIPDQKTFRGLLFDNDVSEVLTRAAQATDPNNVNPFFKLLGSYTQWWKGIVTLTTGFHARNFISNQVTGWMKQGLKWFNIKKDRDALVSIIYSKWKNNPGKILKQIDMDEGVYNRVLNHRYGNYTLRELTDEQARAGLISESVHGWGPEDLRGKKSASPVSSRFKLFDISRDMGYIVENHSKMKSFLLDYEQMMRGADATDMQKFMVKSDEAEQFARDEAKRWWIDYEDLTETERNIRRLGIPFYTWLRRNLANQISAIYTFPEMMSTFPKLEGLLKYEDPDYDPDMIPDWMKQLGMFPVSQMETGEMRMFWPNFPYQDLNLIPLLFEEDEIKPRFNFGEVKDEIVNSTHPFIRQAASMMHDKGYDFFYRRDLEGTDAAPYLFRLFLSKPQTMTAVDGFLRLIGKEDGLEMYIDQSGKLQMNARMAQALERGLPVLRHFEYWVYGGQQIGEMFGSSAIEEAIEKFTGAQDEYEGVEQAMQTMSYFFGIKSKPLDVEEAKKQIARDVYFRSVNKRQRMRDRTPGSEVRKQEYIQNIDRRIARLR